MHNRAYVALEIDQRRARPAKPAAGLPATRPTSLAANLAANLHVQQVAPGVRITFEADRVVDRARNGIHETIIVDNAHFGRLMFVDGALRSSTADEFIYHEMLSHVPVLAHGQAERILILGGADFGLAEEVLKHRGVRRLVQVEPEHVMLKLARTYFSGVNAPVFEDDRFELRTVDAPRFLADTEERFDIILADLPEPAAMGASPLTVEFFHQARACLAPGGVLVSRLGIPFLQPVSFALTMKRLAAVFPIVSSYLVTVPSSFGGSVALGWASDTLAPDAPSIEALSARFADALVSTHHYTPEVHRAAFALPQYLRNTITAATRPDEEEKVVRCLPR